MDPRFALAWQKRENNPELVQDENAPRPRQDYEQETAEKEATQANIPPGKLVSILAVFEAAGWQRKNRTNQGRRNRFIGRRRRGSVLSTSKYPPGTRASMSQGKHRPVNVQPDPYIDLYNKYKGTRENMEDEGFWDTGKSAEDQFGFVQDEKALAGSSAEPEKSDLDDTGDGSRGKEQASSDSDGLPKELRSKKSGKRVVISSMPPVSTIISDPADTGIDTGSTSRTSSLAEVRMDGNWRKTDPELDSDEKSSKKSKSLKSGKGSESDGISGGPDISSSRTSSAQERGLSDTPTNPDLMSRFYARLRELKDTKQEEDQTTTGTADAITRNKDRKRIKTALRRLLADRLFPDEAKTKRSKTAGKLNHAFPPGGDGLTSGTITPLTLGSRSKTTLSIPRVDGSTRANTRLESQGQGRVVFVSENSQLTSADETEKQTSEPARQLPDGEQPEPLPSEEPVSYYRRHPLGTLKNGQVSRLYQPPAGAQRAKTSLSQSSLRQGLRTDKGFLQRLKGDQGIRTETRWSVAGEYPPDRGQDGQLSQHNGSWRREKVNNAWSYNMPWQKARTAQTGDPDGGGDQAQRYGQLNLRNLDDWHLRKLLEELYKDKKYMDKMIETTEQEDKEEIEVKNKMESGREFLLQRAQFWLESGPFPPRPPTTDLGYKLEKLRAKTSSQTGSQSPLPKQTPHPPGRETSTMSSSTIRTVATTHTVKPASTDNKGGNENGVPSNNGSGEDGGKHEKSNKQEAVIEDSEENSPRKETKDSGDSNEKSALNETSNNEKDNYESHNHVAHAQSQPEKSEGKEIDSDSGGDDPRPESGRTVNVYSSAESRTY